MSSKGQSGGGGGGSDSKTSSGNRGSSSERPYYECSFNPSTGQISDCRSVRDNDGNRTSNSQGNGSNSNRGNGSDSNSGLSFSCSPASGSNQTFSNHKNDDISFTTNGAKDKNPEAWHQSCVKAADSFALATATANANHESATQSQRSYWADCLLPAPVNSSAPKFVNCMNEKRALKMHVTIDS